MAERRMFAKTIVLSDAFLDMPLGARCLYMTLSMLADDDGFINSPKSIIRQCGASEDDLKVLIAKKFIIPFDSGVIVIKHWRINNYLQSDRCKPTVYQEELAQLEIDGQNNYHIKNSNVPLYTQYMYTQNSIGKNSIDKNNNSVAQISAPRTRFVKPTVEEVADYCKEKNLQVDAQRFVDYYDSNGWKVGRVAMKDWQATVRNWARKDKPKFSADEMQVEEQDIDELKAKLFGGKK